MCAFPFKRAGVRLFQQYNQPSCWLVDFEGGPASVWMLKLILQPLQSCAESAARDHSTAAAGAPRRCGASTFSATASLGCPKKDPKSRIQNPQWDTAKKSLAAVDTRAKKQQQLPSAQTHGCCDAQPLRPLGPGAQVEEEA